MTYDEEGEPIIPLTDEMKLLNEFAELKDFCQESRTVISVQVKEQKEETKKEEEIKKRKHAEESDEPGQ